MVNERCKYCNARIKNYCPKQEVLIDDVDPNCFGDMWVDFEIVLDNVFIMGYMNTRDVNKSDALQFYDKDGLECYDDFSKTNCVGETAYTKEDALYLLKWCMVQDWLEKTDVAHTIAEHSLDEIVVEYGAFPSDGDEMDAKLQLLINCSSFSQGEYTEYNDNIGAYVKE